MPILSDRWAGLEVHQRCGVACLLFPEKGPLRTERQTISL